MQHQSAPEQATPPSSGHGARPGDPATPGITPAAALVAVVMALLTGVIASLALRPPGAGHAQAQSGAGSIGDAPRPALRWRVATAISTTLPALGDSIVYLADSLRAATDGRIDLQVYEPGELAPAFSVLEAVRAGKVEAGFSWPAYDQGRIPAAALIAAVPFGMVPWEFTAWWYIAGGRPLGERLYHEQGVHPVLCGLIGPETAGWFRRPVDAPEDLRGLKIRFSGLGGEALQRLGASVTVIPGGEIYQALEKGVIDATEFSLPVVDRMLGLQRIARYNYFPGWHQPFSATYLFVNLERWSSLPAATQRLLEIGCQAATIRSLALAEASQGEVLADFRAAGVTIGVLDETLLARLRQATDAVLNEKARQDPQFAAILASQRAFSASYRLWERVAYPPPAEDDAGGAGTRGPGAGQGGTSRDPAEPSREVPDRASPAPPPAPP